MRSSSCAGEEEGGEVAKIASWRRDLRVMVWRRDIACEERVSLGLVEERKRGRRNTYGVEDFEGEAGLNDEEVPGRGPPYDFAFCKNIRLRQWR
jgi:hypothetical protein